MTVQGHCQNCGASLFCDHCLGKPPYDKSFGDDRLCICGHPYYRHFDTYDYMRPIGCKYCGCPQWEEYMTVEQAQDKLAQAEAVYTARLQDLVRARDIADAARKERDEAQEAVIKALQRELAEKEANG